jgi:pilus assembly protein CpaB
VNPKRILVALTLAFFVSGLSTWVVSRKMTAAPSQKTAELRYAAPARALEAGEVLKPDDTRLVAWPGDVPLEGAFSHTADVIGREILFPLADGQPILNRDLSAPGTGTGLASRIPDGLRGVALRSDLVVGVAGFIVPGSHVDVLVTYRSDHATEPVTATVIQNVVVLAVGHQIEPDPAGKASDVAIVTVLLNPAESLRAVLASSQGAIHFVLRNGGDSGESDAAPILLSQLGSQVVAAPHAPTRRSVVSLPEAPKRHEIEMVLGGQTTSPATSGGAGQ